MQPNSDIERAISILRSMINDQDTTPRQRAKLRSVVASLRNAEIVVSEALIEARNIGVRNPEFDGDLIGYLGDDLDA